MNVKSRIVRFQEEEVRVVRRSARTWDGGSHQWSSLSSAPTGMVSND